MTMQKVKTKAGLWQRLLWLVFPRHCPFCCRVIPAAQQCCPGCRQKVSPGCSIRRFALTPRQGDGVQATLCCFAPWKYEPLRTAMERFKFENKREYADCFGCAVADLLCGMQMQQPDCIVYVPASKQRMRVYGYDQARLLAKVLGRCTGTRVVPALYRAAKTQTQHTLTRAQRKQNVIGVFAVRPAAAKQLEGKTVLLLDDIVTTGATLCECARMLYRSGAAQVEGAAVCDVDIPS